MPGSEPESDRTPRGRPSPNLVIALVAGIPGACCLATIAGIVLLASRGDPTSATLNTLAATFGGWFVGGGAFLLLHETGGQ